MAELPWGLQPSEVGGGPFTVVRAEGRTFPSHRCLVPASEFRHRSRGKPYSFSLADGDWFYFAGVWCPATRDWPEAYAILTIEANDDVAPFHDRQMATAGPAWKKSCLGRYLPARSWFRSRAKHRHRRCSHFEPKIRTF